MQRRPKGRGSEFHHQLFRLVSVEPVPEADKPALILAIHAGSIEAAHRAILSHVRLGLTLVGRYMALLGCMNKADDLASAAMEGLCAGISKIREDGLPHTNLTGYLTEYMHRYISDALDRFANVRVPARTVRDKKAKGEELNRPVVIELTDSIIEQQFDRMKRGMDRIELEELLEKIVQSDTERKIIDLRMEGFKDDYIGQTIGLSTTTVFLIRRELQNRFQELAS